MKYVIKHENRNRIRFHLPMSRFSFRQADILEYYLLSYDEVIEARIYERTADAVIIYS